MTRKFLGFVIAMAIPFLLFSQPLSRQDKFDLSKEKVLYLVGYAHMDTEWQWDYPTTINPNIRNTMVENFSLFEKYPDYVFNFTGSRRYKMMEEYYPDLFPKVAEYVKQGRWHISGSSVDEGEVNVSSSESLVRQVLYGNKYFKKEFGIASQDYMLPDCFGFLANCPTIWNHCGILGFSTQKFARIWHPAIDPPFNVGIWKGPDGKGIVAALNVAGYTSPVKARIDLDDKWNERLEENKKSGYSFDYAYYGVGDQGGAPRENDVRHAQGSIRNSDSKFKVIIASSDQMYKDITPEIHAKLPSYTGDLLLIEHSAGSLSSQAYMKRLNRKNEILAQSAEQLAVVADWAGGAKYPFEKLNRSWELLLGSQMHDILPGTSIPKAYEYAWNDEFVAANGFAEVLKNSTGVLSSQLNTQVKGKAVVVYNPVAMDREDLVTMEVEFARAPQNIAVFDKDEKEVPAQMISKEGNKVKLIFQAKVPSVGLAVYDVREAAAKSVKSTLTVTDRTLENEFYRVKIADNGDIASIFDKKVKKELLAKPAGLDFQLEQPRQFPSWNMDWKDRQKPPVGNLNEEAKIRIIEQGPVRVAIEVERNGRNSEISQIYSLAIGQTGKHLEVTNKIDWQSKGVSLKAAFPLAVSNPEATYNIGVGTIKRGNNVENKFEVPSKQWFDLTDKSGQYGVSILEDCRYGSDKPSDNTLRLTLLYTPGVSRGDIHQGSQDWGFHDIRYGIYGHNGDWRQAQSQWQGLFFNQPLIPFEAAAHNGTMGKSVSFLKTSSPSIGVMAFKKMEDSNYYLLRVTELDGVDQKALNISFPAKVIEAYEVNGQEEKIGSSDYANGKLNFSLSHYTIRSFAVKFDKPVRPMSIPKQQELDLAYDLDLFSPDNNRSDGRLGRGGPSFPAELISQEIESESIRFKIGSTVDEQNNAISCRGQEIELPKGEYNKLYIMATASNDVKDSILIGDKYCPLNVQGAFGFVGQFYNRRLTEDQRTVTKVITPFTRRDNIAWFASHRHIAYPSKNDAYQYCYIYKYEVNIPKGVQKVTLPNNNKIIVFSMTVAESSNDEGKALQPLYDYFDGAKDLELRQDKTPVPTL